MLLAIVCSAPGARLAPAQSTAGDLQWKDSSAVQLRCEFPGQGYRASWQVFRCSCGDLLIRSELNEPGDAVEGDIVLVGSRAVLTRGFGEQAAALVSVDAPALMMQLALRLLERAEPRGPTAVTERREIAVEERHEPISLDSGSAAGGFPAPWSVTGALWPAGERVWRFDLKFAFNAAGTAGTPEQQGVLELAGTADYRGRDFPLGGDLALDGWSLGWRDPEDPLAAQADRPATLDDLRRQVRETPR